MRSYKYSHGPGSRSSFYDSLIRPRVRVDDPSGYDLGKIA